MKVIGGGEFWGRVQEVQKRKQQAAKKKIVGKR